MHKTSTPYLSKEFEDFFKESEIRNMDAEGAVAYSDSYQKYLDTVSAVNYAAASSYSKGREEGIAKGRAEGRAEGRLEEKKEMARKMRGAGTDSEFIYQITGLNSHEY